MTQRGWFNVFSKIIGLYWFTYGALLTIEMLYSAFIGNLHNMVVYPAEEQKATVLWSFAMLAVGGILVMKSRAITDLAYLLETETTSPAPEEPRGEE